jgi:hypothetical protein
MPRRVLFALAVTLALGAPTPMRASVVTPLDTPALVKRSTVIVRGAVESVVSGPGEDGSLYTWVSVGVEESLRGADGRDRITLRLPGGVWRDRVSLVHGSPAFRPGESVVLFAAPTRSGHLTVTGLFQGKLRIEGSGRQAEVVPDPGTGARVIGGRGSNVPAAREPLSRFLSQVRALVQLGPGPAPAGDRLSAPAPPAAEVQPAFTLLNPLLPFRWFEPDAGAPVGLLFNPDGAPISLADAVAGFDAALAHWTDVDGSTLVMADGGATGQACRVFFDGSVVSHGDPCGQITPFEPTTCSGVLAITGISGFSLETKVVNGVSFLRMTEADIVFNADTECFFAGADGPANYEEVLSHEMGHVLGLGHSCGDSFSPVCVPGTEADDALMRAFAHGGGRGGAPRADDIDGARFLYPPAGFVETFLNQESFTTGETHTLLADFNGTASADIYVLLVLPNGSFVSIAPGFPVNVLVPAATAVPLGFAVDVPLFSYLFTGAEEAGAYTWVTLLVSAGGDPSQYANWLDYDLASFDFTP